MDFTHRSQTLEMRDDCENVLQESDEHLQQLAHQGAATGNLSLLMDAVNHDPSVLECQDDKGMTPLYHAVFNKQLDMVKLLVRMGAGINTQDAMGRTPLCLAAYEGWYQGVVYLLRSGAKQCIPDRNGRLPLHASTYDTDSKTLSALLQTLTIGDINEPDNDGMTALHWAAFHNRSEQVQLLMLRGADIYITDVDEKTPLHWASQNGCLACCSVMAKCRSGGAPLINAMEGSGKSCIHLAAAAGYSEILEEYTDVPGVDFESLDPDDRTPLHWAAVSGQIDCVKFILELGVTHSPRDINNCTPLDYAKQANKTECLKVLLKVGAEYGVTQSPARQPNGDGKDGTSPRKNSLQGTRKKRFGFLSDIFSRTKSGLRSKQSSLDSNDGVANPVESGEMTLEMKLQKSLSQGTQRAEEVNKTDVCDANIDSAKCNGNSGDESNGLHSNNTSHSHGRLTKRSLEKKQPAHEAGHCHSNHSSLDRAAATVGGSNNSPLSTHRSLSLESTKNVGNHDNNGRWRKRSSSIPAAVVSPHNIEDRNSSPVPDRIPSFTHHSLLPSAGASTMMTPSLLVCEDEEEASTSCAVASSFATSTKDYSAEPSGGGGLSSYEEVESIVGLKPLCRELPDANTVQRHAQEILDAQRGLMLLSKDEGGEAARTLSFMSLMTPNTKLAPLSPKILGRSHRWHSGGSQMDNVSQGFQSGQSTESLTFDLGSSEVTGQSSGTESIGIRSNRFDVLDPINSQQKEKKKKKKKRTKKLERHDTLDCDEVGSLAGSQAPDMC